MRLLDRIVDHLVARIHVRIHHGVERCDKVQILKPAPDRRPMREWRDTPATQASVIVSLYLNAANAGNGAIVLSPETPVGDWAEVDGRI
jgi:hypothetical protein